MPVNSLHAVFEVRHKQFRLVTLDLAVLHSAAAKHQAVQLHSAHSNRTLLVLATSAGR